MSKIFFTVSAGFLPPILPPVLPIKKSDKHKNCSKQLKIIIIRYKIYAIKKKVFVFMQSDALNITICNFSF